MPSFEIGDEIRPEILLCESSTSPPRLLSESDLISLMDKTGIGTDATIHEHIKTIQERGYAHKEYNHFIPTQIGVYLIEAYKEIGVELYKPYLRAQMEKDLSTIAFGDKTKKEVVDASLKEMYRLFKRVEQNKERMKDALNTQLKKSYERERQIRAVETEIGKEKLEEIKKQAQDPVEEPVVIKEISNNIPQERKNSKYTIIGKCVRCKVNDLAIKTNTQTYELFLACQGFPKCKASQNISPAIKKCKLLEGTS